MDGRSFEGISHQDAVAVLRSTGSRVELRVARNVSALSPYQSESAFFQQHPQRSSNQISTTSINNAASPPQNQKQMSYIVA